MSSTNKSNWLASISSASSSSSILVSPSSSVFPTPLLSDRQYINWLRLSHALYFVTNKFIPFASKVADQFHNKLKIHCESLWKSSGLPYGPNTVFFKLLRNDRDMKDNIKDKLNKALNQLKQQIETKTDENVNSNNGTLAVLAKEYIKNVVVKGENGGKPYIQITLNYQDIEQIFALKSFEGKEKDKQWKDLIEISITALGGQELWARLEKTENPPHSFTLTRICPWKTFIVKNHSSQNPTWDNSKEENEWEINSFSVAKLYFPVLGSGTNKTDWNSLDSSALFNYFHLCLLLDLSENDRNKLQEVAKVRNQHWAHKNWYLSSTEAEEAFNKLKTAITSLSETVMILADRLDMERSLHQIKQKTFTEKDAQQEYEHFVRDFTIKIITQAYQINNVQYNVCQQQSYGINSILLLYPENKKGLNGVCVVHEGLVQSFMQAESKEKEEFIASLFQPPAKQRTDEELRELLFHISMMSVRSLVNLKVNYLYDLPKFGLECELTQTSIEFDITKIDSQLRTASYVECGKLIYHTIMQKEDKIKSDWCTYAALIGALDRVKETISIVKSNQTQRKLVQNRLNSLQKKIRG